VKYFAARHEYVYEKTRSSHELSSVPVYRKMRVQFLEEIRFTLYKHHALRSSADRSDCYAVFL
jgi:hypothetical protein